MAGAAQFRHYDLGTLHDLEARLERLNASEKKIQYRLAPMEGESSFWVFEQILSDEESACAVVRVEKGRVVAIGDDAFQFVSKALAREKY